MPRLIIQSPGGEPRTVEIEDSATIGRSPDVTVQIDEAVCSRRHCQILRVSKGFEVVDLKSRNGTKVNGTPQSRQLLKSGDVIEIGETKITFRDASGAEDEVVLESFGGGAGGEVGNECHLVYVDEERKGQKVPLTGDRVTFGRKDSNAVVLKDAMASSYHCEITREGGGYVLRDLGSTNGTIVNGEAVSETTLGHGARIRIGKTRFVFVDPAVESFEQAIASEEVGESDWGLMRAQVDLARVRRARRASLLWLLLFVVVFGGGAVVFATQPDLVKGIFGLAETNVVREIPDNLIPADEFSFESARLPWAIPDGGAGELKVGPGPAHQGSSVLLVTGPADGTSSVLARLEHDFSVLPGKDYEVSGFVRLVSAGTQARIGVAWLTGQEGGAVRYSFSPFASAGAYHRLDAVVTAPPGAENCRYVVEVAGGSAAVDDIGLIRRADAARSGLEKEKAGFNVLVSREGTISVEKAGRFLLWNGGFAGTGEGDALWLQALRFVPESQEQTGGGAEVSGQMVLPGGATVALKVAVTPEDEGFRIRLATTGDAPALKETGLSFAVARSYLSEGATISGDWGATEIQADTDTAEVRKVILGGSGNRMSVTAPAGARFRMFSTPEGLRFALLGGAGAGEQVYELTLDFTSQRSEARSILAEARSASSGGKLGEALRLFTRVVNEFPFDEDLRNQAEKAAKDLKAQAEERLAGAKKLYDDAKDFYDTGDLALARTEADGIAADYEGVDTITDSARAISTAARDTIERERKGRRAEEASRLEERAQDFDRHDQKQLARLFYSRIVELYPDTEAAGRARDWLKGKGR